jgi:hypothetical protein
VRKKDCGRKLKVKQKNTDFVESHSRMNEENVKEGDTWKAAVVPAHHGRVINRYLMQKDRSPDRIL